MGNAIAYLSGNTLTYQPGMFKRGTVGQNFASTLTGGYTWWNSVNVNPSQFLIYCDTYTTNATSESNVTPSAWSTPDLTDASLLNVINSVPELVGQPKFTSTSSALTWLQEQNEYWLVKLGYENIVTDGLVLSLDAGWSNSYGVTYVCGTAQESQTLTITAPAGYKFTQVIFASYGTPNGTCGNFTIDNACHSLTSVSVVQGYLLGQTGTISIPATNTNFGDPCPGIVKRLYVQAAIAPITWLDISGSGNTGTLINGPIFGDADGGYIDFDGTNDIVTFGSKTLTDIGLISQAPMTAEAWVQFDSLGDYVHIIDGSNNCFHLAVESTAAGASVYFWNGLNYQDSSLPGLKTGQWYHIVGVQDTSQIKIYVDGILLVNGTLNSGAGNLVLTGNYLALGYWQGQNARYLNGKLAITRLYKKALSLAEIQQNFNAQCNRFGVSNNYVKSGLISYLDASNLASYPGSGTDWFDLTGNGNKAIINPTYNVYSGGYYFDFVGDGSYAQGAYISNFRSKLESAHTLEVLLYPRNSQPILLTGPCGTNNCWSYGESGLYFDRSGGNNIGGGFTTSNWQQAVITYDGNLNAISYMNGNQVATSSTFNMNDITNGDAYIGSRGWAAIQMNYAMAYFRFYDRKLSQSEIRQNYYQGNIVTSNLLFYYDAGNLISYPKSGTSTRNLTSLSTNVGTLNNGVGFSSNNGGYFTFDGTDDNINIGTVGGYSNQMTCEAWFRTTSSASWKDMICGPGGDVIFTVNGNVINFGSQGNSPIPHINYSNTVVNTGAWFYAAATYNGSTVNIYINGVLDATYARTGSQTPGNLRIGSNDAGTGEFYNGDLPIVRMYSTALSQSQIIQNFNSQKSRFGL
jgi:hypothetical protein